MKILLINHNPVVSRLTALSAKKENVELHEIKDITELKADQYNVIFVDSESYSNEVATVLQNSGIDKKVLFYTQGEAGGESGFNETILKPFLPSEVSAILRQTKIDLHNKEEEEEDALVNFDELIKERDPSIEALKSKEELLPAEEPTEEVISTKEHDLNTLQLLKQQLEIKQKIEEKVEVASEPIVETPLLPTEEQDEFDLKLAEAFPPRRKETIIKEKEVIEIPKEREPMKLVEEKPFVPKEETKKSDEDLFELDKSEEESKKSDDDLFELDKEVEGTHHDDLLDFDFESHEEVDFSESELFQKKSEEKETPEESKTVEEKSVRDEELEKEISSLEKQTKILDVDEISNIKALLDDDTKTIEGMPSLVEETVTPKQSNLVEKETQEDKIEETVVEEKEKSGPKSSEVIAHTLGAMPVDELRRFLRGAKIHITIEFPNEL